MKNKKGITLISLVITIVVLVILSAVAIYLALGNNGILNKAEQAKEEYLNAQALEEEKINDLYSQMLIATNDSSQITISMEDLNELIDKKVEQKIQSMNENIQCIDTSKEIASIGTGGWVTENYSYTATEDCVVTGKVGSEQNGIVDILINSKNVGSVRWAQGYGWCPVNYNLKKGDTIEFKYANDGKSILVYVKIYGLK